MNPTQFYISVAVMPGITILVVLLGILLNNSRFNSIERTMESRFNAVDARFNSIEARMSSWETRFDILVGKVADIDNRLSRLEERLAK